MARTVSGRVDGWHLRSIQCSTVIAGSAAAPGLLSNRNIESNCGHSKAFERSTFLLSNLSASRPCTRGTLTDYGAERNSAKRLQREDIPFTPTRGIVGHQGFVELS